MKKFLSLLLVLTLTLSGTWMMVNAQETAKIEYAFTGADSARAGYAEGSLSLYAPDGEYLLYWAGDSGALNGYYPISPLTVRSGVGSYSFSERVAIPAGASRLIAVPQGQSAQLTNAVAQFAIPTYKQFPYESGQRLYRSEVLSDIHIDQQDGGGNIYYKNASKNFALALKAAKERDVDFVVSAGDQITNASGATLEWLEYQRVIAESDYDGPVYESIGNHEIRFSEYSNCTVDCGIEEFITATGTDGAFANGQRKPYFEVTEPVSGDHFIFMALETNYSPAKYDEFSDEQIAWLQNLLAKYNADGHRTFVIQHALISGYGPGDDKNNPAYGGAMTATPEYPNNLRFKQLTQQYKDIIWLSGHSHVDFQDEVNFTDENGSACLMFHIPSTAGTTRLSYDGEGNRTLDRTFYDNATQGYILDAYSGAAILHGINFYDNKIYPAYTYIIGDTPEGEPPTEAPTQMPTSPSFIYGDADCDGKITTLDATAIQRHIANIKPLTDAGMRAAMVGGSNKINVIDATLIQRFLAKIISSFPVEKGLAATAAADISSTVKAELQAYYQYASYAEYAALKRAYHSADIAAMQSALNDFRSLRGRVQLTTVYFTDAKGLGHPYAYAWRSSDKKEIEPWPGQKTTYVRTNSMNQQIYAVTVDAACYDSIIFNNNGAKTADIRLAPQSGRVYYAISDNSPYDVTYSVMNQMWRYDDGDTATIYFTDTQNWGKAYVYYWNDTGDNSWPGTKMTYVRQSSTGKGIYTATVPANAKVIINNGSSSAQTADIPAVADGFGYYPYSKNTDGKWSVIEYKY